MSLLFAGIYSILVIQRLGELVLAKSNERWMKERGAKEIGQNHYKYIVILHISFLLAVGIETILRGFSLSVIWAIMLGIFVLAQFLRFWTIKSLGRFWNTKIIVLPDANVVKKGPYRYIKHPNYMIVALEIISLPLIFSSYITAIVFTLLNGILLVKVRIPIEEKALKDVTDYRVVFSNVNED